MNNLNLNAYGVTELSHAEKTNCNGGGVVENVIRIVKEIIRIIDTAGQPQV